MKILLISFLLILSSCSKVGYIIMQGKGQISLELSGVSVEDYLNSPDISDSKKNKVRKIQLYKNFFYKYFSEPQTSIYDSVTSVPNDVVTYLVIASPQDKIEPVMHSFPVVGDFPYLGFFEKEDAQEFVTILKNDGYSTYLRNVYAYSTLNQWIFNDNILSSFFHYEDKELATLIFHELFHTVFFIPNEVALNEAAAQYFSERLTFEYFNLSLKEIERYKNKAKRMNDLNQLIVKKSKELNALYKESKTNFDQILSLFLKQDFLPKVKAFCADQNLKCWPLTQEWNNARFAAFNTYEANRDVFEYIQQRENISLKDLFTYLKKEYKTYKNLKKKDTFDKYLLSEKK